MPADLLTTFVGPLERMGLTYMVTGGVASVVYGDPRFTRDVDLVLELEPDLVASFHEAFPSTDFYVPPVEEYFRASGSDRHLRDIAMMLRISEASINGGHLIRGVRPTSQ